IAADAIAAGATAETVAATADASAIATPSVAASRNEPLTVVEEHRLTTLESGVRIVTEEMPSVRSVSLGFWVGTGSRAESDEQAGLSHLLEHLLFKGSERYASLEIDQIFDGMGAELNAGTGKETTSVYARVIDSHLEPAFDVMADIVFRPLLNDVDSERAVILEEIAMYEDDPQEKVFDVLGDAVFGSHPLGRAIIGRAEVIAGTPLPEIVSFHAERYAPSNIVIAAAGAVNHDRLVAMAQSRMPDARSNGTLGWPPAPADTPRRIRFEHKDTEQYHVCVGGTGISRHDDRRFALRVLDTIFGGTSSSRLFQEVRERRGLAYAVYSFIGHFQDSGQVGIYVGTRADNLAEAASVIGAELVRLQEDPATPEELTRAKENLKGRVLLSLESTGARMNRLGSEVLANSPLLSLDALVARIDAVELDDLRALATELWSADRLSAAGIGPGETAFREALGAIEPALVK
ncbi:MAG: insulinase family protein, partial [Actinomycetota bacterium]|nr:insulinase family protein [Actinomycetota bacterium]